MPFAHVFFVIAHHLQAFLIQGGYVILFAVTVLEGIPLVGMIFPGHVAIIFAGFLAKIGTFSLTYVLVIASAGAIVGDFIGFWIGRKYGISFIDRLRPYFFITDAHLEKARRLLDRHTGKAMIVGRFSPVTRALMPFLIGTSRAKAKTFWIFNVIGGVSWAVVSVMAGYVFGAGYDAAAGYIGRFAIVFIIAAALIIWGYRFVNMRFHIFKRYELFTLALNLVSLWVLMETIQDAWSAHSYMANFDVWVNIFSSAHITLFLAALASTISYAGGTAVMASLGIIIAAAFVFRGKWRSAAIMLLSIGSTSFAVGVMKEFFMRARPENALQLLTDYSFPSGHAALSAAFFVIVAYLCARHIKSSWVQRESAILGCVLAVILIGLSRIALNVHWSSDVIAGWSLGVFLATASILLVRYAGTVFSAKMLNPGSIK